MIVEHWIISSAYTLGERASHMETSAASNGVTGKSSDFSVCKFGTYS